MSDLVAKGTAVAIAAMLALSIAILVVTSSPPAGARQVTAEFDDAFPLIEGMHVRVDGAIAGSVGSIDVNDRGNAEISLVLNDSIEAPMADASARIQQQDTTGDSYVAFDPGGYADSPEGDQPLGEDGIVCETHDRCGQTLVSPRLDDLLNAFGPDERAGVQLLLVESAKALDRRGGNLNRAALTLRPAVEAASQAITEVSEQNQAIKSLIRSAESVTGQAAERNRELASLIESLAMTTNVTAANLDGLDAGLEALPETAAQARGTLAALTRVSIAAKPLADRLAEGAPELSSALARLPGFLDNAEAFLGDTRSVLTLSRRVLTSAEPTLKIGKKRVITGAFDLTGATADLLNAVLGGEDAFPALFDDDSYGEPGGSLGRRGFGAVAVQPGDLSGYGADHAERNWLRVSAVINCEVFGVPVAPGCLTSYLTTSSPAKAARDSTNPKSKLAPPRGTRKRRPQPGGSNAGGGRVLPDLRPGIDALGLTPADKATRKQKKKARRALDEAAGGLLDYLISNG